MKVQMIEQIRFYKLWLLFSYLNIRYQIYIKEFKRSFSEEFSVQDLMAHHYVFLKGNEIIGIVRVLYKGDIAELSRIAIIKEHRNKGYGTTLINQIITNIKSGRKAKKIRLFTENKELISFYEKFGFENMGEVYFEDWPPCFSMIKII
jgi:predicted GNAT family N-acyltransferase